jgi:hypothetical protein
VPAVFVYESDLTNAQGYQTFLNANQFPTTILTESQAATYVYTGVQVVIIGYDFGAHGSGIAADASAIYNTGLPILGMGDGGTYFFFFNGPSAFQTGNTATNTRGAVNVVDPTNPVWSSLYTVSTASPVTLYNPDCTTVEPYLPSGAALTLIGQDSIQSGYYPVANQVISGHNYIVWGFEGSASTMTAQGQLLFLNLLYSL